MNRLSVLLLAAPVVAALAIAACAPAAPAPTPTKAPAAPTKAVEPTKAPAAPTKAAEPTRAPASQPTAAPAKKVDFPAKGRAITFIVPWPPGGGSDVGARLLAAALEKELGVPVQVVNRAGAGSQVGITELATSKPDGYTIGLTNLPSGMTPYLDPERKAQYGRKDLVQVANTVWDPESTAVKPDSPVKTAKDLVDAVKAKPNDIKVGAAGILSDTHLAALMWQREAGIKFNVVQFDGGGPHTTALLGGHIDASFQTAGSFAPVVKSKQVRLLGIMDKEESRFFPGVKTFRAQGYNLELASSRGVSVPAGTPREIVDVLSGAIKKVMDTDDLKKKMDEAGLPARFMDSAQYTTYWDQFEAVVKPLMELGKQ